MKIKRVFESLEPNDDQFEEVESIFTEFLDEKKSFNGEDYETCKLFKKENCIMFVYYFDYVEKTILKNDDELGECVDIMKKKISTINRIRVALKRLSFKDYEWSCEVFEDNVSVTITYISDNNTLLNAFIDKDYGNHNIKVNQHILGSILKKTYNVNLIRVGHFRRTGYGYYSDPDRIYLYIDEPIDTSNQLYKDLYNLKKVDITRVFNKIELSADGIVIKLEY